MKSYFFIIFFFGFGFLQAQNNVNTLPPVTQTYALKNVFVIQKPGQITEGVTLLLRDGIIQEIGPSVEIPGNAQIIEGDSLYVYAGFIDGLSHTGVPKADKKEQRPRVKNPGSPPNDIAGIQPETQVKNVLNPKDKSIAGMRKLGFTAAHVVPRGRMLPGSGAVALLGGDSPDAMILKNDVSMFSQLSGAGGVYPATVIAVMSKWRELYKQAEQAYKHEKEYEKDPTGMKRPSVDRSLQAFYPVVKGEQPVYFMASDLKSVHRVLTLQKELRFPLVLTGLKQGWSISSYLKENETAVLLSLDLPEEKSKDEKVDEEEKKEVDKVEKGEGETEESKDNKTDKPVNEEKKRLEKRKKEELKKYLTQAAVFEKEGIRFGFTTEGTKSGDIRANLRKMIENGLSEATALAALTTIPAKILGVSSILGTVEKGKIANLLVTDKPYFEEKSNVRYVFVDGKMYEYEVKAKKKASDPKAVVKLNGSWSYTINVPGQSMEGTLEIKGNEKEISGTVSNPQFEGDTPMIDPVLEGNELTFSISVEGDGQEMSVEWSLIIEDDTFEGSVSVGEFGTFDVEGTRTSGPEGK
ncbi:MAG: amidohydrolase family protein [Bacteroidetes bacterium]|nr:amidohydrolase family protein [Bacteroidota bacterium]